MVIPTILQFHKVLCTDFGEDIADCCRLYLEQQKPAGKKSISQITGFQLVSTNIFRKYIGILDLLFALLEAWLLNKLLFLNFDLRRNYTSMMAHHSQFVWFRHLFVLFSRYTFINTLEPITLSH